MTVPEEHIKKMQEETEGEWTEHQIEMLRKPVHKRKLITCPVCGDQPSEEQAKEYEELEQEGKLILFLADIPCSKECEITDEL